MGVVFVEGTPQRHRHWLNSLFLHSGPGILELHVVVSSGRPVTLFER